jgi:glycosyltransferase involved in cell wall biosynthesis
MNRIKPLISVVIAVFNGAKTLQRCIDSVSSQTFASKQLIIIDGASLDATVSILERNAPQLAYWESKRDSGIANAWNKALKHATGEWIIFLGADDRFQDEYVLSDMAEILKIDLTHDVVYGKIIFEGGPNNGLSIGSIADLTIMKRRMVIPHTATFHRRSLFDEIGQFDQSFKMAMDYELLLRKKSLSSLFINRQITVMGGEGVSSRLIIDSLIESRFAQIKNTVDYRIKIEAWHLLYYLRYLFFNLKMKCRIAKNDTKVSS